MPRRVAKRAGLCRRRSWSDLPHDLLGEVIRRLPAFGDRLRLRVVCRQWRRAERAHAEPAAMPWLAAPGHCISLRDAAVHRVALPGEDASTVACRGSFGNWLALVPVPPSPCQPFLLNPFTTARVPLPAWTETEGTISKIVLSSAPDSENCTVAAFGLGMRYCRATVAACRLRQGEISRPWWRVITENCKHHLEDIAFFDGNLHALDGHGQAYVFVGEELQGMRAWPLFRRCNAVAPFSVHNKYYLVACHGRLLMVCRSFGRNRVPGGGFHTVGFKVFDVSEQTPPKVKRFDGHVLFVGDACCGAFAAAVADEDSKGEPENQICYADDETDVTYAILGGPRRPLRLLQSYDMHTDCLRRYQPVPGRPAVPWQCVRAQRLLRREALPPAPATEWGATLLLWEVMSSLGADRKPCYSVMDGSPSRDPAADIHVVLLFVCLYGESWRFTMWQGDQCRRQSRRRREKLSASSAVDTAGCWMTANGALCLTITAMSMRRNMTRTTLKDTKVHGRGLSTKITGMAESVLPR